MRTTHITLLRRKSVSLATPILVVSTVILATIVGAAIGTFGSTAALGLFVIIAGSIILALFARRPVTAMLALWLYEVIRLALASFVGYNGRAGQFILQADDFVIAALLVAAIWRAVVGNFEFRHLRFVLPGLFLAIIGVTSDFTNHVSLSVGSVGMWEGLRIWVLLAIAVLIPWRQTDHLRIYSLFVKAGIVVAVCAVIDLLAKDSFRHFLHTDTVSVSSGDYRYSSAVESIFTTPAKLSLFMSLLFAMTLAKYLTGRQTRDIFLSVIFAITALLSLRLEAALSVAMVVLLTVLFSTRLNGSASTRILVVAILLGITGFTIAGSAVQHQVATYTSSEATVRSELYTVGERIAKNKFPLGSGFGTYGSSPSRQHYSSLYVEYGLSQTYGLSREHPEFIEDTSWPSVLAETGYLGLICYILGIIFVGFVLLRSIQTADATKMHLPLTALCGLAIIALQSVANPTLFDGLAAVTLALFVGPALAVSRSS